ncbi:MAG: carboxy terminal-processing peptidase [Planctomycetaceae bacterium]
MIRRRPSRASNNIVLALALLLGMSFFAQQFSAAAPKEQEIASLVAKIVPRFHINRVTIDDAVSEQLFKRYFHDLDPLKLYFLQSDLDAFAGMRTSLDDSVKAGNVDFADQVFDTFRKRLSERVALANELIDQDFDFTIDESILIDADELPWATDDAEIHERWRKRVKYDVLQLKLAGESIEEARERLHKRYRTIKLHYDQMERIDILELYLTTLTNCFDPHSSYMSPDTVEDFTIQMKLSLDGIGASLRSEDGYTLVHEVIPGGAADKDGRLQVGDKIIGVGQAEGEIEDIVDLKLRKVVEKIRGPRGTTVRLQVKSETDEVQIYEMVRQKIELKESEVKGEVIETSPRVGRNGRIGVIHIPSFYRDFAGASGGGDEFTSAARDVAKVLADFQRQGGVDAIIVDLRKNGGGSLTEAIEVSGHFIDHGPVVQVKGPDGTVETAQYEDKTPGTLYSGPLVVVCNRASASASEIFAGVIKDYNRGIIVGDSTTHGKGTVQNVMPVSPNRPLSFFGNTNRGSLKLTISQFYRVNGDSTQNRGVRSDVVLPSLIDHLDVGEMYLENALPFDQIPAAQFVADHKSDEQLLTAIREASRKRVDSNEDFAGVQKRIRRFLERKSRKTISLNEKVLEEELELDQALAKATEIGDGIDVSEEPEAGQDDSPEKGKSEKGKPEKAKSNEVFPQDFYNNEVIEIALDYIEALNQLKTVQR